MTETTNKFAVEIDDKMYQFTINDFNTEIDLDELLQIETHNIYAEMVTISTLFNKIGILKAQAEEAVKLCKLDVKVHYAQLYEAKTNELYAAYVSDKGKKPTKDDIESACVRDQNYIAAQQRLLKLEKEHNYVDSIYWSVKNKAKMLEGISAKLSPEEFDQELVEQTINLITIKERKKRVV